MLYNGRFKKTFARIYNKIIYLNFCKTSISSPSSSSFIPVSHAQHVCQVFSFLSCIAVHSKRCIVLHINIYNKTYIVWSLHVCLLVTTKPIDMLFGVWTWRGPMNLPSPAENGLL